MKLLCYGEILWDIIEGVEHIGGATFNFAAHSAKLGQEAHMVSALGRDERGRRARETMRALGVHDEYVRDIDQPTGIVPVTLDAGGTPTFEITYPSAWDFIEIADDELDFIRGHGYDCLYFGVLCMRSPASRGTLERLVDQCSFGRVFCDINFRQDYYDRERVEFCLRACDILKLNDEEAVVIGRILDVKGAERAVCDTVRERYDVDIVCVTAGAEGCRIYAGNERVACPGRRVEVADTVGSGDAFAAAMMKKIHEGASLAGAGDFACALGALVASRSGAVPDYDASDLDA